LRAPSQPLARDSEAIHSAAGNARAAARSSLRRPSCPALPANTSPAGEGRNFDEQLRPAPGPPSRRRRSVSVARLSAAKSHQRDVRSRGRPPRSASDHALGGGGGHDLLVERHKVLQRTAAARDDSSTSGRGILPRPGQAALKPRNRGRDICSDASLRPAPAPAIQARGAVKAVFQSDAGCRNSPHRRRGVTTPITSGNQGKSCLRASSNSPLGGELDACALPSAPQRARCRRASIASITIWYFDEPG